MEARSVFGTARIPGRGGCVPMICCMAEWGNQLEEDAGARCEIEKLGLFASVCRTSSIRSSASLCAALQRMKETKGRSEGMRKAIGVMVFTLLLLGDGTLVCADQLSGREIRHRIHETQERIERGAASGSLTRHEVRWLQGELEKIRGKFEDMRWDGLSYREAERLEHDLERLNRDISREKQEKRRY